MAEELDEIKNLTPEERIKRLKELEEKRKAEIEEAHKLLKQTEAEIEEEQKELEQLPIPQLKAESDEILFGEPEREMFRAKRFVSDKKNTEEKPLEETVWESAPPETEEHVAARANDAYVAQLSQRPVNELTQEVYKIAQDMEQGDSSEYNIQRMYTLKQAIGQKRADIESGQYNPGDKTTAEEVDIGYKLAQEFAGSYHRGDMDKYRRAG